MITQIIPRFYFGWRNWFINLLIGKVSIGIAEYNKDKTKMVLFISQQKNPEKILFEIPFPLDVARGLASFINMKCKDLEKQQRELS